jgi:hypothetical protein
LKHERTGKERLSGDVAVGDHTDRVIVSYRTLERLRCAWEDHFKMEKKIMCEDMGWILVALVWSIGGLL